MTQQTSLAPATNSAAVLEKVVVEGDLSKLTSAERIAYYRSVCESLGLNPLTRPFEYVTLQGKLTLYARKDATEQIRVLRGISVHITDRQRLEDVYIVTARATDKTGRWDEATGVVAIGGLKGDNLANALMKAETKAKRRVTLSIAGLGIVDETEIETIKGAQVLTESDLERQPPPAPQARPAPPPLESPRRIQPDPTDLEIEPDEQPTTFDAPPTTDQVMELAKRKGVFLRKFMMDELGKDSFHSLSETDRIFLWGQLSEMPDKPQSNRR